MLISRIARTSRVLGKSQGYLGLPVRDEVIHDAATGQLVGAMTTAWEPTPAEVAAIRQGARVYLRLFGTAHPPTMIWAGKEEPVADEVLRSAIDVEAVARGAVAVRDLIPNLDVEAAAVVARDVWAAMLGAVLTRTEGAANAD